MSALRSQDMSLYQIMISRDNSWDIMNELLELDFLHYVPLNDHKQPHELLYMDILRRAEEIARKIQSIERMYSEYNVDMKGPESYEQLETAIQKIVEEQKCHPKKLIDKIEADVTEQERFLKKQDDLQKQSLKGFKDIISRINVLKSVAKILKIDPDEVVGLDVETGGLTENLLDKETIEATGLAIIGGTIAQSEENTLKRLLFRSTRGKAMLYTQDIVIDEQDLLLG